MPPTNKHPSCQILLLFTSLLALHTCPHSKVEESFNLQATHDLFYHGLGPAWRHATGHGIVIRDGNEEKSCAAVDDGSIENGRGGEAGTCGSVDDPLPYDHVRFPGVVPRTFFGAFILSYLARIISWLIPQQIFDLPNHPMAVQFLIRLELLLLSWFAHVRLAKALEAYFQKRWQSQSSTERRISKSTTTSEASSTTSQKLSSPKKPSNFLPQPPHMANYYLLITASQFHIPFYSSRLLPNTFALLLATHAYAEWFQNRPRRTAIFLVFTTAIFRCDVLLLLFTVGLTLLIRRQLGIVEAIITGVITGVVSLVVTVPLDSLLWGRLIWPEFEVWWFNTVDNRSGEWGKMVWHWYFTKALPKGMLLTGILLPLAFFRLPELADGWFRNKLAKQNGKNTGQNEVVILNGLVDLSLVPFFLPVLGFIMLYSFLPHKEMRFIFPALPILNACAAYGMSRLHYLSFPYRDDSLENVKHGAVDAKDGEIKNGKDLKESSQSSTLISKMLYTCGLGAIVVTIFGSLIFLRLSIENYPGGVALMRLHHHLEKSIPYPDANEAATTKRRTSEWSSVRVHVDVAAAMTGVSLFGQRHASSRKLEGENHYEGPFRIEKSGYEEENMLESSLERNPVEGLASSFSHLLTESDSAKGYHVLEAVKGYPSLDLRHFQIVTHNAIYIMEKDQ